MPQKQRIAIVAVVVFLAGVIFFLPQLQKVFGLGSPGGQIKENILAAMQEAEQENKPIFLDFYGGY